MIAKHIYFVLKLCWLYIFNSEIAVAPIARVGVFVPSSVLCGLQSLQPLSLWEKKKLNTVTSKL